MEKLEQWIIWKKENKKAYLRLVNLSLISGILIGICWTLIVIELMSK